MALAGSWVLTGSRIIFNEKLLMFQRQPKRTHQMIFYRGLSRVVIFNILSVAWMIKYGT